MVLCLSYTYRGIQDSASSLFQILSIKFVPTHRYKKYNWSLRLIPFSPFAVILPALYNFLHWQWSMQNYSTPISELFFTFLRENVSPPTNFHVECCKAMALQAARNCGAKLTHLCCGFRLVISFFSRVKNIAHSSDWLQFICAWKWTTHAASQWLYLSMYIIKSLQSELKQKFEEI